MSFDIEAIDVSWLLAAIDVDWPDIAKAYVDVIGMERSAPNMATMPRTKNQRWNRRFLTTMRVAHLRLHRNIVAAALLTNE